MILSMHPVIAGSQQACFQANNNGTVASGNTDAPARGAVQDCTSKQQSLGHGWAGILLRDASRKPHQKRAPQATHLHWLQVTGTSTVVFSQRPRQDAELQHMQPAMHHNLGCVANGPFDRCRKRGSFYRLLYCFRDLKRAPFTKFYPIPNCKQLAFLTGLPTLRSHW